MRTVNNIKYTPEKQKVMMEMYLDGYSLNNITEAIGSKTKREQGLYNQKEGKAVETKVYKLWSGYRNEVPLFDRIKNRDKKPWGIRELKLLRIGIAHNTPVSILSRLSGRTQQQIQTQIEKIKNYKQVYYKKGFFE